MTPFGSPSRREHRPAASSRPASGKNGLRGTVTVVRGAVGQRRGVAVFDEDARHPAGKLHAQGRRRDRQPWRRLRGFCGC